MEVVGQRFIFDEFRAMCICVARDNENVNFQDENGIEFYSFYFYLTSYMLQLTVGCSIIDQLRSFTLDWSRSRESNSTQQAMPS